MHRENGLSHCMNIFKRVFILFRRKNWAIMLVMSFVSCNLRFGSNFVKSDILDFKMSTFVPFFIFPQFMGPGNFFVTLINRL